MSREHPRLPLHRPPLTGPASRSYSSYRHPQQMPHGQPEPGASYRYPLPPPSYPPLQHLPPETDPIVDNIVQRITQSTSQMIGASQAQSDARLNRLESMLQRITTDISSARQESRDCVVQIAEVLQKSHAIQLGRLKRLENILGMGPDIEDEKTLLNRFDLLSFAVEDLLERVKDPEANLPDGPLHHDMATSPAKRAYANAVIPPKTPSPKPQTVSAAVGSSSPIAVFSDKYPSSSTVVADDTIPTNTLGQNLPEFNGQGVEHDPFVPLAHRDIPKATFAAAPPVSRSLVPVDWQDQSPSRSSFTFNPDRSPAGMQPYTALPNQPLPSDGTVAALRQASLGDRFAGPLTSTPCRSTSVHPVSPALSVSLPPSPRQITPFRIPSYASPVDNISSPATPLRSFTPENQQTPPPREPSVGAHAMPSFPSPAPEGTAPSRSGTVEADSQSQPSPSADTLREELSVLDLIEAPRADTPPKIASPRPLPSMEPVVPSSVTPSPMLVAQVLRTSPPRLTVSIPRFGTPAPRALPDTESPLPPPPPSTPPRDESDPGATDPYDAFMSPMSPLSPTTPSTSVQSPTSPSASAPVKSEPVQTAARPRTSGLKPMSAAGQAAAPRARKRKGPPGVRDREWGLNLTSSSTEEPPLKRVRPLRSVKKEPTSSLKREKGKRKQKAERAIEWPDITPEAQTHPEFIGKFVGCDRDGCERWYHYTCLNIVPGDPRLTHTFHCPPCAAGHTDTLPSLPDTECSRPGCPVQEKFFEPEGVYGRRTKLDSTLGRVTEWLVFWKGYTWGEVTWESKPPSEVIETFKNRASAAGFNLDDDACIILREAREGGVKNPDH